MEISNLNAKIGEIIEYEGVDCKKCEGSGVIAFKPIKEIPETIS